MSALPPYAGPFDAAAAAHLLRRAGYGPAPAEVARAVSGGLDATVDRLLAEAAAAPEPPGMGALLAVGDVALLQAWWMRALCDGPGALRERATLCWHDHFATSWDKVRDVRLMHAQYRTLREHALGDLRALLHATTVDPALLVWLDGALNRVGAPNENHARELLELFGLGRGHYTERDVRECARALSGWTVEGRRARFAPERHDGGTKRLLGVEGNLDERGAVDAVLAHPACPRWFARRIALFFVGPEPDDALVDGLSEALVEADWSAAGALRALLRSEPFFAARRSAVASPVALVADASRAFGVALPPAEAAGFAERLGQSLFRPPTVEGWAGGRAWLSPSSWIARQDFAEALARRVAERPGGLGGLGGDALCDALLAAAFPGEPAPPWRGDLARLCTEHAEPLVAGVALVVGSPEFQVV